jgi:pimeloyl-ACP methyl ester carboxylesterase
VPEETRPVLFGSSLGGLAAAWFTALNPDRVAACALVAPAFSVVANLLVEAGPEKARRWKEQGSLRFQNDQLDLELSHEIVEDAGDYPEALLYSAYRTPTLVAHGMRDAVVPYQRSLAFAEGVQPGLVDLHLFGDGDHPLHGCMPEVMDLLERFVERRLGGEEEGMRDEG